MEAEDPTFTHASCKNSIHRLCLIELLSHRCYEKNEAVCVPCNVQHKAHTRISADQFLTWLHSPDVDYVEQHECMVRDGLRALAEERYDLARLNAETGILFAPRDYEIPREGPFAIRILKYPYPSWTKMSGNVIFNSGYCLADPSLRQDEEDSGQTRDLLDPDTGSPVCRIGAVVAGSWRDGYEIVITNRNAVTCLPPLIRGGSLRFDSRPVDARTLADEFLDTPYQSPDGTILYHTVTLSNFTACSAENHPFQREAFLSVNQSTSTILSEDAERLGWRPQSEESIETLRDRFKHARSHKVDFPDAIVGTLFVEACRAVSGRSGRIKCDLVVVGSYGNGPAYSTLLRDYRPAIILGTDAEFIQDGADNDTNATPLDMRTLRLSLA